MIDLLADVHLNEPTTFLLPIALMPSVPSVRLQLDTDKYERLNYAVIMLHLLIFLLILNSDVMKSMGSNQESHVLYIGPSCVFCYQLFSIFFLKYFKMT